MSRQVRPDRYTDAGSLPYARRRTRSNAFRCDPRRAVSWCRTARAEFVGEEKRGQMAGAAARCSLTSRRSPCPATAARSPSARLESRSSRVGRRPVEAAPPSGTARRRPGNRRSTPCPHRPRGSRVARGAPPVRAVSRPELGEQGGPDGHRVRVLWPLYAASADGEDVGAGLVDSTTALDVRGGEVSSGPVGRPGGSSGRQVKSPSRTASAAAPARMRPRRRIRPRASRWRHGCSAGASSRSQASPTRPFLSGCPVRSRADGSRGADRAMASSLSVRNRVHTDSGVGFGTVAHFRGVGVSRPARRGAAGGQVSASRRTKGIARPASRRADSEPSAGRPRCAHSRRAVRGWRRP